MGWREYFEVAKCYLLPAFFAFRPSLTAKARKIRKARKKFVVRFPLLTVSPAVV